jgi:cytochrome b pre-mRNA-processing protein 3
MKAPAQMLQWFKTRSNRAATARQLYGSSVAAARNPVLFSDWHVADTMEGRFEMVVLHVGLLLRRLTLAGPDGKALGQGVLEQMVAALDDDMRELGISDLRVGKKVQAAASAFYGRLRVYDEALTAGTPADLEAALAPGGTVAAGPLSAYVRAMAADLAGQPMDRLAAGTVSYVPPVA